MPQKTAITKLMSPPPAPVYVATAEEWKRIETAFSPFPSDFKWFLEVYGSGRIAGFLRIWSPFDSEPERNLVRRHEQLAQHFRKPVPALLRSPSLPLYPKPGGLLYFGVSDNGDSFFWRTSGRVPDDWAIEVHEPRGPVVFQYTGGVVSFLVDLLTGEVRCSFFPDIFPPEEVFFKPDTDR